MPSTTADAPLYEMKANLFKALAHPARIRILEILVATEGPCPVSDILDSVAIEASLLSQHLSVLKRHNVVTSTRVGNTVTYQLAHRQVAGLLQEARAFLVDRLATEQRQLALAVQMDTVQMDSVQMDTVQMDSVQTGSVQTGSVQTGSVQTEADS